MKHEKSAHTMGSERGVESQPTLLKKTQLFLLKQIVETAEPHKKTKHNWLASIRDCKMRKYLTPCIAIQMANKFCWNHLNMTTLHSAA